MCSEGVVYDATNEFSIDRKILKRKENVIFHFPISQSFFLHFDVVHSSNFRISKFLFPFFPISKDTYFPNFNWVTYVLTRKVAREVCVKDKATMTAGRIIVADTTDYETVVRHVRREDCWFCFVC